ncbi:MAG: glycosyltransferase family 2 protein [Methylococcales bacterium]|nr:glycosyltransferase family 2 protein [Methylococcales bacterium]
MTYRLSIVFLNFNRVAETRQTTETLRHLCQNHHDVEIIAVDNGSCDGTAEYLAAQHDIGYLSRPDNSGIAGYNTGFEHARGEFVLVLDDDSCPADWASVERALQHLEQRPELGLLAFHIVSPDGSPQSSWHLPDRDTPALTSGFIGCGFLIRRSLLNQIGGYPGDFFLYQNEAYVAFKIRQAGFLMWYAPDCRVIHRGQPSSRPGWRRVFFPTRNTLWLIREFYPRPLAWYLLISRLLIGLVRAVQFGQLKCYVQAAWAGLSQPRPFTPMDADLRREFSPFLRQNSLWHQLTRNL